MKHGGDDDDVDNDDDDDGDDDDDVDDDDDDGDDDIGDDDADDDDELWAKWRAAELRQRDRDACPFATIGLSLPTTPR